MKILLVGIGNENHKTLIIKLLDSWLLAWHRKIQTNKNFNTETKQKQHMKQNE